MEANRLNKLTQQARRESYSLNHDYIGSEHLLLALMKTDSVATKALEAAGANYDLLRQVVINNIGKGQAMRPATEYSKKVRQILELARLNANKFGNSSAGEEDVLFAILADDDSLTNIMFLLSGVEKEVVKRNLKELLQDQNPEVASIKDLSENVSNYARDLNEEAESGKIDPVIGRDDEIERVIQILMRRTKNNPILIGEPGVGKTAISEGLAQRIVEGEVPRIIEDKTILSLDLASMIAGTKYRGDFEERLKKLFDELATHDEIILFIDEFHMVLGAGAAEGSMDAANILKPILAKGDIQIIGATTIEEYRKYIEKDSALTRRMQPIQVEEPSLSDSRKIIYGIKDKYEAHHGVEITDDAINAAVELTDRYINDRYLPDKAIDVIDEAMSKVRIKAYQEEETSTNPQEKIQELVVEKEQAVKDQDFEKAAELRDRINQARFDMEAEIEKKNKEKSNLFIGFDDIASIVASWSKVPVTKLTEDEKEKYANLDHDLEGTVIGQQEAIKSVAHAIKRARVGLKDPSKPIGSFIFVGPTGVGKTYLAKSLAENIFGSEEHLIRMDMSEYMEKFAVSRLVGSPPGYVGYEEGGQLTEQVRNHPYSVILFDEIEKAHPDIFNLLLQILDDGRLTDGQGRTVDFKNTIIIMTSNVGVSSLNEKQVIGFETGNMEEKNAERTHEIIEREVKNAFAPEFLNRLDEVIMFNPLSEANIEEITKLMLEKTRERLNNIDIDITYDADVVKLLAKEGFNEEYGARPLERHITKMIDDRLAEDILDNKLNRDAIIHLSVKDDELKFENVKGKRKETLVTDTAE
ncbi:MULTISPECIES: ATP-dependent Clp protease ATP-binding subunit [Anaerococcus]|uniref:ATP-dependent Clp protease ATP-binding protein ClpC n=1 Tax=Anaerococcus octavius TaxID=54007 RepID=A0A2I1M6C0_9FIRM|nr:MULTISPECIES: ATP-dependent Clp protease ATP-binding subunit [Anaerococcus]MDU4026276.1 ATP-dependent Clp protease ATP-binding subunit [Anaerococcus sp.]MDU7410978.1 ATP-dependent Clp protease ATP-binding subunit [Anaerococcus sp.]PKZ15671.1 ATP-dependent Clp protease ATP-binding protein ClpC [Anaerococcus octavius]